MYVGELTLHVNVCYNIAEMSSCLVQVRPCLRKMDGWSKREGDNLSHYCAYHLFSVHKALSFGGFIEPK